MTKKQTIWTRKYNEKAYARLAITIPKSQKQAVETHAQSQGKSVNGLVNELLREHMGLSESEWKKSPEAED